MSVGINTNKIPVGTILILITIFAGIYFIAPFGVQAIGCATQGNCPISNQETKGTALSATQETLISCDWTVKNPALQSARISSSSCQVVRNSDYCERQAGHWIFGLIPVIAIGGLGTYVNYVLAADNEVKTVMEVDGTKTTVLEYALGESFYLGELFSSDWTGNQPSFHSQICVDEQPSYRVKLILQDRDAMQIDEEVMTLS